MNVSSLTLSLVLLATVGGSLTAAGGRQQKVPNVAGGDRMRVLHPATAPGPLDNPMKGWCSYVDAGPISQPYSMVYFYVSWKELEPREGEYRFAEWEKRVWDVPAARGKQVVLRVYLDYPSRPSGIPDWLLAKGVQTKPYKEYGGGLSPDYDDPHTVAGMERLIAAMGRRYDGNPRVAFVEMGLLGFWGEWHTYPRVELFASAETQKRVLDAARRAFPHTIVMTRNPADYAGKQDWLGFFDDMFPEDTDGPEEWKFLPKMRQSGRAENWKRAAIGGEMEPHQARKWLGEKFGVAMQRLEQAHFSWVGPYNPALGRTDTPEYVARSQAMVRRMGYEFALDEIRYTAQLRSGARLELLLIGKNQGVAPFYYPWPVELALLDAKRRVVATFPLKEDIRRWLPGPFRLSAAPKVSAPPGRYTLALGIRDPWTNRPAIGFANALPRYEGWMLLSDIEVLASAAPQP